MQQVTAGFLCATGTAEEGRNFQFADRAVHLDLPFSPNRLEQRIGRLDRYGRGTVIPTYAIESAPGTITAAWKDCLTEGFGVFDTSIASLQFAIDGLLPEVHDAALDDGAAGLARMTEILPGRAPPEKGKPSRNRMPWTPSKPRDRAGNWPPAMKDIEDTWLQIEHSTEGPALRRGGESPVPPGDGPKGRALPLVPADGARQDTAPQLDAPSGVGRPPRQVRARSEADGNILAGKSRSRTPRRTTLPDRRTAESIR